MHKKGASVFFPPTPFNIEPLKANSRGLLYVKINHR